MAKKAPISKKKPAKKALPDWSKMNRNEFKRFRVLSVISMILKRVTIDKRRLATTYKVDIVTIYRDIDKAKQRIMEFGEIDIKVEFGKILKNYDQLYVEAVAEGNINARLVILDKLTHLFNLHKPIQIDISGTIEHKGVPESKEELELKNRLMELTGGQRISNN